MAIIADMGGSFNPLTDGHVDTAREARKILHPDRMRLLFSNNPLKDPTEYAPLSDRMEMGRIRLSFHPGCDFELVDEETRLGTHFTYEVLSALRAEAPGDQHIWVMGTDNFATFDTWREHGKLLKEFSFAVLRRESRPEELPKEQEFMRTYTHLQRHSVAEVLERHGWLLLDNEPRGGASREFRKALKAGTSFTSAGDRAVAAHARTNHLYGL